MITFDMCTVLEVYELITFIELCMYFDVRESYFVAHIHHNM